MKKKESKYAICPYYHGELGEKIYCEGLEACASSIQVFSCEREAVAYRKQFCYTSRYGKCPHADTMKKKHEASS